VPDAARALKAYGTGEESFFAANAYDETLAQVL
jgi:hypothetical protein